MPKKVAQVGEFLEEYLLKDFHLKYKGFLKVVGFDNCGHPWVSMHRGHAVIMLPVDYEREVVWLIEQPRANFALAEYGPAAELLEQAMRYGDASGVVRVPSEAILMTDVAAGMVDEEDGSDPIEAAGNAALRELTEEVGIVASKKDLELVSDHYVSVGGTTERHIGFLVDSTGNPPRMPPPGDGTERIAVYEYTFAEARRLLAEKKVRSGSLAVLLRELFLRIAEEKLRKIADFESAYDLD